MSLAASVPPLGRIGPNAITRVAQALPPMVGAAQAWQIFRRAGLLHHLRQPPGGMVDEADVTRLHRALREALGPEQAAAVASRAGTLTADYLLAHRIPTPVQWLLKALPARWAAGLLLRAIQRHAWTFAGSGHFQAWNGRPVVLQLQGNPLCRGLQSEQPSCHFYAATFERLFQVLVHPRSQVRETACEAQGAAACRFELRWDGHTASAPATP